MRMLGGSLLVLVAWAPLQAQQVADSAFRYPIASPAYEAGTGPVVCIDEGHHNFHTMDGRYLAFANLLRDDGYRVRAHAGGFSEEALTLCRIVVIANAVGAANAEDWAYPHASAFTKEEISALLDWLRGGGSLLLIADHAPWPGAASDLAILLGVQVFDGYVGTHVFGQLEDEAVRQTAELYEISVEELRNAYAAVGELGSHVIVRGRNAGEVVPSVVTFTGQAFHPAHDVEPLLILGPEAVGRVPFNLNSPSDSVGAAPSHFPLAGWLQGAALRVADGRVVVLGEAATCTAQLAGPQRFPMGMSAPLARHNARFCLNTVRWLDGVLKE